MKGAYFSKAKAEVRFYRASGKDFMLLGVLPDSNKNIYFRLTSDVFQTGKSFKWYVWKINEETIDIGELTDEARKYDLGFVAPCIGIIQKIKTGEYPIDENLITRLRIRKRIPQRT